MNVLGASEALGIVSASGSFLSTFSSHYARTHRAKGKKNLRCFPSCRKTGHRASGYCGSPVILSASIEWDQSIIMGQPELFVFAEFRPVDDNLDENLKHVDKAWVHQHCRSRNDFMQRFIKGIVTSRAVRQKEGGKAELSVTVEFNGRENMGWHYYWNSGRYRNATLHSMRCYIMVESPGSDEMNNNDGTTLTLAHFVESPSFSIGAHDTGSVASRAPAAKTKTSFGTFNTDSISDTQSSHSFNANQNSNKRNISGQRNKRQNVPESRNEFVESSNAQNQQKPNLFHKNSDGNGYLIPESNSSLWGSGGYLKPDFCGQQADPFADDDENQMDGTSILDDIEGFQVFDDLAGSFSMTADLERENSNSFQMDSSPRANPYTAYSTSPSSSLTSSLKTGHKDSSSSSSGGTVCAGIASYDLAVPPRLNGSGKAPPCDLPVPPALAVDSLSSSYSNLAGIDGNGSSFANSHTPSSRVSTTSNMNSENARMSSINSINSLVLHRDSLLSSMNSMTVRSSGSDRSTSSSSPGAGRSLLRSLSRYDSLQMPVSPLHMESNRSITSQRSDRSVVSQRSDRSVVSQRSDRSVTSQGKNDNILRAPSLGDLDFTELDHLM